MKCLSHTPTEEPIAFNHFLLIEWSSGMPWIDILLPWIDILWPATLDGHILTQQLALFPPAMVHIDLKRGKKYNLSPKILGFFPVQKLHFS